MSRSRSTGDYGHIEPIGVLNDISDVSLGSPITDNYVLTYDSALGLWGPEATLAIPTALDDLTDVDVVGSPTLVSGMVLTYNGTKWDHQLSSTNTYFPNVDAAVAATDEQLDYVTQIGDSTNVAYGDALIAGEITAANASAFTLHEYNENRIANVVTDYNADPTGTTSSTLAFTNAITDHDHIYIPPGTYLQSNRIWVNKSNVWIEGAGSGVTTLKIQDGNTGGFSQIDMRETTGANISNIKVSGLTLDGNHSGHTGSGNNCILVLSDISVTNSITDVFIEDCIIKESSQDGILMQGLANGTDDGFKPTRVNIRNCSIHNNERVGISQFKTLATMVTGCTLYDNGAENLTIDVYANNCMVIGNRFFRHLGGTGNIGIDAANRCIIANNLINNQNSASAATYNRNGISSNAQHFGTNELIITGNMIVNCANAGIFIRDSKSALSLLPGGGGIHEYPFEANGFIFPIHEVTGTHDGADNAAVLTDSGASWTVNEHVGKLLFNHTDDSYAVITANTATTVTGVLAAKAGAVGTDNDWDIGDTYYISPYDNAGQALITGNNLVSNGTNGYTGGSPPVSWEADIVIANSDGPVHIKGNKYDSIVSLEPTANTIRMDAGDVAWNMTISSFPQTVVDDGTWKVVPFDTISNNRLATRISSKVSVPVGTWYHLNGKVRLDVQNLAGSPRPSFVALAIKDDTAGIVKEFYHYIDSNIPVPPGDIIEIDFDYTAPLIAGEWHLLIRADGNGTGTLDIVGTTKQTWFNGISLG